MLKYITNLFKLSGILVSYYRNIKEQKNFIQETLFLDIAESKKNDDKSLDQQDYKKITDYYGLGVAVFFGESFCLLRGKQMSQKERTAITYLGGLSGLFDDFFDKKHLPEQRILQLIDPPNSFVAANENEKLYLKFYRKSFENIADKELLKSYFSKGFEAEQLSKNQLLPTISLKEIIEITQLKGGLSALFYRCTFGETLNHEEKAMLYKLGEVLQMENDVFDVYKDYKDGIKTLATISTSIIDLERSYLIIITELKNLVSQTNYPSINKNKYVDKIMPVICMGFIALDKLKMTEKSTGNVFQIEKYQRKELVCDMEKWNNFLKGIHYFAKYN